ncbi:GNAT family N-acetyltransferase [Ferrovibrio xuzhouensis]|uniref:GNAT family N-acetyltransferase n=1 Tax=Ferrovibrio xuzhouensis TaxID=1576914 RepID=A0ABV7VGV3_9PROT
MTAAVRLLAAEDRPALDAFLQAHAPRAMFLRANLAHSGLVDGVHPYQGRYAAAFAGDAITGVAAHYWNGFVILLAGDHAAVLAATAAAGRHVAGLIGLPAEVAAARAALAARDRPVSVDSREGLYRLPLAGLQVPPALLDGRVHCRPAAVPDLPLLAGWRFDFDVAMNGATESAAARAHAQEMVERWVAEGSQFVLCDGNRPVAGCCFNATLPDMVQIGNVWTPPELRGRGHARAVVAGALQYARHRGVTDAILFTGDDNHAAQQAYVALGFTRIGDYAILLFADQGG